MEIAQIANRIVNDAIAEQRKHYEQAQKPQDDGPKITVFEDGFERVYLVKPNGVRVLLSQKLIFWLRVEQESKKHDDKQRLTNGEIKQMHSERSKTLMQQLNAHAPVFFAHKKD